MWTESRLTATGARADQTSHAAVTFSQFKQPHQLERSTMNSSLVKTLCALALTAACGAVKAQSQSLTYRMYLFDPDPTRVHQVVQGVEQALSSMGRVGKTVGLMPSPLPARPAEPAYKTVQLGPFSQQVLSCDDAYARIYNESGSGNALGSTSESSTGCIYPTLAGTRVAFVFRRTVAGNGFIGSAIVGAITKAVQGSDVERARKNTSNLLAEIRKLLPEVLVELVEVPGTNPERPDAAKVEARLTAVATKLVPVGANATSTPVDPVPPISQDIAVALDARKQLTAIGLAYYAVEAFHEAIRRRDALAVKLFIDAGGVSLTAKGKDGLAAMDVVAGVDDLALVELVRRAVK
jgi:hypothetical protein